MHTFGGGFQGFITLYSIDQLTIRFPGCKQVMLNIWLIIFFHDLLNTESFKCRNFNFSCPFLLFISHFRVCRFGTWTNTQCVQKKRQFLVVPFFACHHKQKSKTCMRSIFNTCDCIRYSSADMNVCHPTQQRSELEHRTPPKNSKWKHLTGVVLLVLRFVWNSIPSGPACKDGVYQRYIVT